LKQSSNISTWLHSAKRRRRSPPWACTAGLGGIPRYFYTAFGGSCDSGEVSGLIDILIEFATSVNTFHAVAKTIQGKTVYLAKITHKLVTKVNIQSALHNVDKTLAQGGLAATFDLATIGVQMIAPVKKSVNQSKTLTSMHEVQGSLAREMCFSSR